MPPRQCPIFIGGETLSSNEQTDVHDKHTGEVIAACHIADESLVDQAIEQGDAAREPVRKNPAHNRRDAILALRSAIADRHEEFAQTITAEVGKPISFARAEVDRCLDTLRLSSEACEWGLRGEQLPMDGSASGEGFTGLVQRFPVGLCLFITPFNFPLNLLAHKIGPAIAAGCPFIAKPSEKTPVTTSMVAEILTGLDLPRGAFAVLNAHGDARDNLTSDDRIRFLSFTGSDTIGWKLRAHAGTKKVSLELGGNAACIVDERADLDLAVDLIAKGAYGGAGQSCISVQRILCHDSAVSELRDRLIERINAIKTGDPRDEETLVGPMIDEDAAKRVESWIDDALRNGAEAPVHGKRSGALLAPTLLTNVDPDLDIARKEAFGPVAVLDAFRDFEDALRRVNDSEYGLQAGVFTPRLDHARLAFETLDVGGVVINDVPTKRVDSMPYGGVKASGLGREGVRYAIEEMTEPRLMLMRT